MFDDVTEVRSADIRLDTRSEHRTPPEPIHHHRRTALEARMINGKRATHWVCGTCHEDLGWE